MAIIRHFIEDAKLLCLDEVDGDCYDLTVHMESPHPYEYGATVQLDKWIGDTGKYRTVRKLYVACVTDKEAYALCEHVRKAIADAIPYTTTKVR